LSNWYLPIKSRGRCSNKGLTDLSRAKCGAKIFIFSITSMLEVYLTVDCTSTECNQHISHEQFLISQWKYASLAVLSEMYLQSPLDLEVED